MNATPYRKFVQFFLFLPPLLWVIYRLQALDVTHDEAWSFHMAYKQLYSAMLGTANNHWLNTIALFVQSKLFGTAIWQLRLHSLLGFFILLYFLHKIALRIPNPWIGFLAIVMVLYNTYILDFFSIARGYGLGLAFGMAACYFILYPSEGTQNRLKIYTFLCLAAASVYTELYLLLGFGLYELLFVFRFNIFSKKKFFEYIKPLWLPIIFLGFAFANILYIKKCGDLNEGQSNGFFMDTLGVFIQRAFEPWFFLHTATILGASIFALLLIALALPSKYRFKQDSKKLSLLLLLVFGIHQLFFYTMDTPYAFGRTALYYIVPLFVCSSIFMGEINYKKSLKIIPLALFILCLAGHISYALKHKNIQTTQEWWMGQGVSDVVEKIYTTEKRNLDSLSLLFYEGHNGDYQNYYKLLPNKKTIDNNSRIHPFSWQNDFNKINQNPNTFDYILLPDYDSILHTAIQFQLYDSVSYYPDMKTWLLRKKF